MRLGALVIVLIFCLAGCSLLPSKDKEATEEVLLESAASPGPFPWTSGLVPDDAPTAVPLPSVSAAPASGSGLVSVRGDRAGIYGGSLELGVCDKDKLVAFLESHQSERNAWASVLGVSDVGGYVASLTPVVLAADTRVTNHGFADGRATPHQSVLQAGTAVLVDDRGIPRVRCECGNPLLPPVLGSATYTGTKWPGFDPGRIIVVQPAPVTIVELTVVNVDTGGLVTIPTGGGAATNTTNAIPTSAVLGYWVGDWGEIVFSKGPDGVITGAYSYDQGVLTGSLRGNRFVGRWCEEPRAGNTDAGPVEFMFLTENGVSTIDGRWKYDADPPGSQWREDWDLQERTTNVPPAELQARADDVSKRCT